MSIMKNYNRRTLISLVLLLGFLEFSSAYPTTIENNDNDNEIDYPSSDVPSHLLRFPLNVEIPSGEIETIAKESPDVWTHQKRQDPLEEMKKVKSCCPVVVETIEPFGGKNRYGDFVELYQSDNVRQRLYEISCDPSIADQHCKYLDKQHHRKSRCTQQYSYTYALVRDFGNQDNRGWRLDYVQVRSGCACTIANV